VDTYFDAEQGQCAGCVERAYQPVAQVQILLGKRKLGLPEGIDVTREPNQKNHTITKHFIKH
jgi:hypothetical protein